MDLKLFENIGNFFVNYWFSILLIVVVFGVAIFLYVKNYNKTILNALVLKLVVEAEKELGEGTGKYKFNAVLSEIYDKIPFIVRIMIPQEELTNKIEFFVSDLKKFLESGGNLLDYKYKSSNTSALLTNAIDEVVDGKIANLHR